MEARKITIVATNVQKKYVLNSTAETLGDLKVELSNAGISYEDMTFMEGLTRTEMKDNSSLLPTNVKRIDRTTGVETYTNELVFMLTNTAKKIKSGAMSRAEVYAAIKSNNLQGECMKILGKNFTQCSTASLTQLISENKSKKNEVKKSNKKCSSTLECVDTEARAAIKLLVDALYNDCVINRDNYNKVNSVFDKNCPNTELVSPYSDDEIASMFSDMQ